MPTEADSESSPPSHDPGRPARWRTAALALGALGVVYGDIGTSPLYAIKVAFAEEHGLSVTAANILGVLSLILWSLVLVISVKYTLFIMRADNRGEGGILALLALIQRSGSARRSATLVVLGLFGAALLYGDGVITPAISVLSAVEGLEVAAPGLSPFIVPVTLVLLLLLFAFQYRGTAGIGAVFGPVMLVWFATLGTLGLRGILGRPDVLVAINPLHALRFFAEHGLTGVLVLGAVFLVVTGGEALYADMGHFGKGPIRLAWFSVAFPALLLNYFGQGAMLLSQPEAIRNPFYLLAPEWFRYPLLLLAAVATIIASQAIISGSFSLTRQAVQLGYSPRLVIRHTSSVEIGQIYVPAVNWALMIATVSLVVGFRSSDSLAAAYGIAVTTTMLITSLLFFSVARHRWGWKLASAFALTAAFVAVDLAFFGANVVKVAHGGWVPLVMAAVVFLLMSTWKRGREILSERLNRESLPVDLFLADVASRSPLRVPGTAVFMTGNPRGVPPALLHNLKHNQVLHQKVVFVTVITEEEPHVPDARRAEREELGNGFYRVILRYGFMQTPHIPEALRKVADEDLGFDLMRTTYFLGRESLVPAKKPAMPLWREKLFVFLSRNSQAATGFFGIPPNRVVELGAQIEI